MRNNKKEMKLIKKEPITAAEAKTLLSKVSAKELSYEQKMAVETIKNTVKLTKTDAVKLKKELEEIESRRLKPESITKIVDIVPENMNELKAIFVGENLPPKKKGLEKILKIVKPYVKKKK